MKVLFELHYEDVAGRKKFSEKKRASKKGNVYSNVAYAHRHHLNQKIVLPKRVREIFQKPADEDNMDKLNELAAAVRQEIERLEDVYLHSEGDIEKLARAVEGCEHPTFSNMVGPGFRQVVPEGCLIEVSDVIQDDACLTVAEQRAQVASLIRSLRVGTAVRIKFRPMGTIREPPLDPFAKKLMTKVNQKRRIERLFPFRPALEIFDVLLVALWDALFLTMCEHWTAIEVSNINPTEAKDLLFWFYKGQELSKEPLFSSICAMCGALLYTTPNRKNITNCVFGPPLNRDGDLIADARGQSPTQAQPPFLLRFSPKLFAEEAPAMFDWDETTNRLQLKDGRRKPWLRELTRDTKQTTKTWCYCAECHERYLHGDRKRKCHVPYRDRASQYHIRPQDLGEPVISRTAQQDAVETQPEPEEEPLLEDIPFAQEDEADAEDALDALPLIQEELGGPDPPQPVTLPTLEEYQKKWEDAFKFHTRGNCAVFSNKNLVPKPIPQLFQDCPWVPFPYQVKVFFLLLACILQLPVEVLSLLSLHGPTKV